MRFKQYLNENESFDIEKFKLDCAFYLDLVDGQPSFLLYHGTRNYADNVQIREFKPRDVPRDSPKVLHDKVNEFFTERFGYPFRNALFTTGKWTQASNYGPPTVIVPIGKFEWLGSWDIEDLTGEFEKKSGVIRHHHPDMDYDERVELASNQIMDDLHTVKFLHNENFEGCISSHNEIMIKCDNFYQFDMHGEAYQQFLEYRKEQERINIKQRYDAFHNEG